MADIGLVKNKKGKAPIWADFFLLQKNGAIEKNVAVCKKCSVHVKYAGGTSNLVSHLRVYHAFSTTRSTIDTKIRETSESSNQQIQKSTAVVQTLPNILAAKYSSKSPRAIKITNAIALYLIKDLRPYSTVESPHFRRMLTTLEPRYIVPNRHTFSDTIIPQLYDEVKEVVKSELRVAEQVALTTDGWTSRATESYVTITSTHISPNWELVNYVLQTRSMPESHTGQNIADVLNEALEEWSIPKSPVYLVSDNASNMTKAATLLGCDFHLGCYAHTLNLAAQKALKLKAVSNVLAHVRRIVGFFHRSSVAAAMLKTQSSLLEIQSKKLKIDVCTRWNSAYEMLERYLELQVAVVGVLMSKDLKFKEKDLHFLSDDEIKLAEEIVKCMEPIHTATATLCSEKMPTLSAVLPLQKQMLDVFLKSGEEDPPTIKSMKNVMATDLANRYNLNDPILLKSTALDPRFKSLPFLSEQERFNIFNQIITEVANLPPKKVQVKTEPGASNSDAGVLPSLPSLQTGETGVQVVVTESEASCSSSKKLKKCSTDSKSGLLDLFGDVYVTKVENKTQLQMAEEEVMSYKESPPINVNENPLQWWKQQEFKYPSLSRLVKKVLCIPGTSVPSERVFSTAGDILSAQRANLKSKNVDKLIFLKKNID